MRVLITGSNGFIGSNLAVRLEELAGHVVRGFSRGDPLESLADAIASADAVVHLAGVNRPKDAAEFVDGNLRLTQRVCATIEQCGRRVPLILASSTQAELDNPYGVSKRAAEQVAEDLSARTGNPVVIYRLPNVFGKWCRPNYNSVVATFCHNVANDLPLRVDDPAARVRLVHVDDVVSNILTVLEAPSDGVRWEAISPEYHTTVGELAAQIQAFRNCRDNLVVERVGTGLVRALYSTYVSYLPTDKFAYGVPCYGDQRGVFVEMLKTIDSGQFSFFTAHPGVTRGGHYHHAKTEKFLVIKGTARFHFRHVRSGERYEIDVCGDKPMVVETIPGWAHDITNTGTEDMIVMLWANEIFDRARPDTIANPV